MKTNLRSYTIKFKMEVAKFAKARTISEASRMYEVDRKRVREWIQQLDAGKMADLQMKSKRLPGAGRKVTSVEVDNAMYEWFCEKRSKGLRVTGKQMKMEAQRKYISSGFTKFKASRGWLQSWKKRHSVSFRVKTTVAQKMPDHMEEKITNFHRFVIKMRKMREYELSHIGNMDETAVYFDMPGNSTLHHKGDSTVIIRTTGHEKEKITVILGAMADGRKLPPVVVLKGKREPPASSVPSGVLVRMSDNGWCNEAIIKWWLLRAWRRDDKRKLLIWDSFRAHRTEEVKTLVSKRNEFGTNTDIAVIPGGCTSVLQPADVSWNRPFKGYIQEKWDAWMVDGQHTFTAGGRMRKPEVRVMLQWVKEAWEQLSEAVIVKSFKKTGISNELDGTEDEMLWEDGNSSDDDELDFPGFETADVENAKAVEENKKYDAEDLSDGDSDKNSGDDDHDPYLTDTD